MDTRIPLSTVLVGAALCLTSGCKLSRKSPANSDQRDTVAVAPTGEDPDRMLVTARTAVYAQAKEEGKSMALLQAGETVVFLGDSLENASKKDWFYKIRLSDGAEGWARNYGLLLGKPAVSLSAQPFYQRPDLMSTKTGALQQVQLVVVQGAQDEFVKVAASRWKSGWVLASAVVTDKEEVIAAALASRELGSKQLDPELLRKTVDQISSSTKVYGILQTRLDSLVGPEIDPPDGNTDVSPASESGESSPGN